MVSYFLSLYCICFGHGFVKTDEQQLYTRDNDYELYEEYTCRYCSKTIELVDGEEL